MVPCLSTFAILSFQMAILFDLPLELLQSIIVATIPEGIESAALSCRTLYNASKTYLADHNKLRREWSHFAYDTALVTRGDPWGGRTAVIFSALGLLDRITENPLIARYIRVADLRNEIFDITAPYGDALQKKLQQDDALRRRFIRLLGNSRYLSESDMEPDEFLETAIGLVDIDASALLAGAFLMTLLPNVQELALPRQWRYLYLPFNLRNRYDGESMAERVNTVCWKLFDSIVQKANSPDQHDASLAKLHTIKPFEGPGYDEGRNALQLFTPFISLPSVRSFSTGSSIALDDGYTGKPFDTRYDSFGAQLEHVYLEGCCIDYKEITKFLSKCKKLKTFKFNFEMKWHGCGSYWDAGHFARAVEAETYSTLEVLSLGVISVLDGSGSGIVSLKKFQKLRAVELGLDYFTGPPCGREKDLSWDEHKQGETVNGQNEAPSLWDLLPSSVEDVVLMGDRLKESLEVLQKLFHGCENDDQRQKLPNLRHLEVRIGSKAANSAVRSGLQDLDCEDPMWKPMMTVLKDLNGGLSHVDGLARPRFIPGRYSPL